MALRGKSGLQGAWHLKRLFVVRPYLSLLCVLALPHCAGAEPVWQRARGGQDGGIPVLPQNRPQAPQVPAR